MFLRDTACLPCLAFLACLACNRYGGGVDVWAMGCLFAELLQRETLFVGENELDQLGKITALLGHPDPDEWPE